MYVLRWFRDMINSVLFSRHTFEFFQGLRINITKNYHYSPIPDIRYLKSREIWKQETQLPGIQIQAEKQLQQMEHIISHYRHECNFPLNPTSVPYEYYMRNDTYGWICAIVYHSLIRYHKPRKIIEIGAGRSTYLAARAICINQADGAPCELIAIDPFPNPVLQKGFPGLTRVLKKKVEDLNVEFFSDLEEGDILFINSTHTVRIGGDVTYLFLEVLPRLKPGVLAHIHDVYWPRHYPFEWIVQRQHFWAEQYLLQAFLAFNDNFEILWSGNYLTEKHSDRLRSIFSFPTGQSEEGTFRNKLHYSSNSFWMRRVKN